MYSRIKEFNKKENTLRDEQYGFRKDKNTTLACFDLIHTVTQSLDNKIPVAAVFLDLSSAFDFVDHTILLNKLYRYGFRGNAYKWVESYLRGRSQCTEIERTIDSKRCTFRSQFRETSCGVPQGSVLGPLLFIMYTNDLPAATTSKCIMFADDTTLIIKGKNKKEFNNCINTEIDNIMKWLNVNKLKINLTKTKFMQFLTYNSEKIELDIGHDSINILEEESVNFLGFVTDHHCNWKKHIQSVCDRLDRFIFALRKLRQTSSLQTAVMAYNGYVASTLNYGLLLWGNSVDADQAFIIQKKCIRAICCKRNTESARPLFKNLNILTLPCTYVY